MALTLLAGCSRDSSQVPATTSAPASTLPRDDLGREIKVSSPRRIISLAPGATETIFAMGAGDRLIGRDQMSNYPPAAKQLPQVADFNGPFFEKVVALRPDLIIAQGETLDRARIELWEKKCGVPVVLLNASSIKGVADGMKKIAAWLGVATKPGGVADFSRQARQAGQKVFFEVGRSPLWTAGDYTLIGAVLTHAGLSNVASIRGYKEFNIESLLKADPDFYIVTAARPDHARTLRELKNSPGLKNLRCVRNGKVIVLNADWVLRPGPRLKLGILELTRQINALKNSKKLKEH